VAIGLLAGSFILSTILTGVAAAIARRVGFVCRPAADRFADRTVPLGGGIAIFATISVVVLGGAVFIWLQGIPPRLAEQANVAAADFVARSHELIIILLCGFVLFALGLWDDIRHLGPWTKLAVQFTAAIAVAGFTETRVEFFIHNRIVTTALSAFWIVLIINAFNFLDNMDGLSAGIATIAAGILLAAAVTAGQVFVAAVAILLVGTLLGFLVHNFPPARVFMGDAGALVTGFFVAILTLRTTYYQQAASGRWYCVFLPVIVMAVPLYDFLSVTLIRLRQGKSPFVGDTQHFSHRLSRLGLSDTQAVLTLYLATLTTGLGATFLYQVGRVGAVLIFTQAVLVLVIVGILETAAANDTGKTQG